MKRITNVITVFFFLMLLGSNVNAQEENRKFFIGGNLSFSSEGYNTLDRRDISFDVVPYFGYNISGKAIIGLGLGYSADIEKEDSENSRNSNSFVVRPFVRYRKGFGAKFGLYGEFALNVGVGSLKIKNSGNTDVAYTRTQLGASLGPGIDYKLSDRWFVHAQWGLLSYNTFLERYADRRYERFGLSVNPRDIRFGLNFMF